jgi:hypothetical protein
MGNCLCENVRPDMHIQHIITENLAVEFDRISTPVISIQRQKHKKNRSSLSNATFFEVRDKSTRKNSTDEDSPKSTSDVFSQDELEKIRSDGLPTYWPRRSDYPNLSNSSSQDFKKQLESINNEMAKLLIQVDQLTRKAVEIGDLSHTRSQTPDKI